jgi:hypothetical protein
MTSLSNTDAMKKAYTEHYALVRKLVPKKQLLELGSGDEWERLCGFLEKDVPVGLSGQVKQYPRSKSIGRWSLLKELGVDPTRSVVSGKAGSLKPC